MSVARSWEVRAAQRLAGRRIAHVAYLSSEQTRRVLHWSLRPPVLILDDGQALYPSLDAEGNGAGALRSTDRWLPVLPPIDLD